MKWTIPFEFQSEPTGGGNQFLTALRHELQALHLYTDVPDQAAVVLLNANPKNLLRASAQAVALKQRNPHLRVIYRVDGPISLIRGQDRLHDYLTASCLRLLGDGVIWQSAWSRQENTRLFRMIAPQEVVIHNAPDPTIFFRGASDAVANKIKLIATSWSANPRKGFTTYRWLDQHLDFSKYDMTFVGNSPITFRNITHIPPLSSTSLAKVLRQHHMYITASENDPCSNALIEAIVCGLPAIAKNSGGHPELVRGGGQLFTTETQLQAAINEVSRKLDYYRQQLPQFHLTQTTKAYRDFANSMQPHPLKRFASLRLKTLHGLEYIVRHRPPFGFFTPEC